MKAATSTTVILKALDLELKVDILLNLTTQFRRKLTTRSGAN